MSVLSDLEKKKVSNLQKQASSAQVSSTDIDAKYKDSAGNANSGSKFGTDETPGSLGVFRYPTEVIQEAGGIFPFITFTPFAYKLPEANIISANNTSEIVGPSVQLYMPEGVSERMGAAWGPEEVFNLAKGAHAGIAAMMKKGADAMGSLGGFAKASAGASPGPTDLFIFNKPNPFTLAFNFHFVPRNSGEAKAGEQVVTYFKKMALPTIEPSSATGLISWPAVWSIKFSNCRVVGSPSTPDGKYLNMALTDCSVTFSGGSNSTLVFSDAQPVRIAMSLSFQSVEYAVISL